MPVTFEEAKKRIFEEAGACQSCASTGTLTSTTLGTGDVLAGGANLIPYLVWNEINIYPPRRRVYMKAFLQTNVLVGAAGTKIYVPIYDQDEFTAQTSSEQDIDTSGYTKTKPSPAQVEVCITDVVYNGTKISDILREDSPTLGWVRASLQLMGFSIGYKMEQDMEACLFAGGISGGNVQAAATAGVLSYADVVDCKALLSADSFYDMGQPFLLYINPEQEGDLLKELGPTNGTNWAREQVPTVAAVGEPIGRFHPIIANCMPLVTEVQRDGFALVVVPPTHPYGPAAMFAWKRPLKLESFRDEQYGRDVWILSTRYGLSTKRDEAIGVISNC